MINLTDKSNSNAHILLKNFFENVSCFLDRLEWVNNKYCCSLLFLTPTRVQGTYLSSQTHCLRVFLKRSQYKFLSKILDRFLPYEARAEICQKFGWLFGRFEDTKISFWEYLTFSSSEAKLFFFRFFFFIDSLCFVCCPT